MADRVPNRMKQQLSSLTDLAGHALAGTIGLWGAVTGRIKPLHPKGALHAASLVRHGRAPRTGSDWLDSAGTEEVVVRRSRAVGLPPGLPDIPGMALTTGQGADRADVLFAGTGTGKLSRHVLLPAMHDPSRSLTTLLPYASDIGLIHLCARARGENAYDLAWAVEGGPLEVFARLELGPALGDDEEVSFDPVRYVPTGLRQLDWVQRLREPAYLFARARSHRRDDARPDPNRVV